MRVLKIFLAFLIILLLAILTQIGGLIFLLSTLSYTAIEKRFILRWERTMVKFLSFFVPYFLSVFLIVPLLAKPFGRVPLPLFETRNLQPGNIWTFLLNRNYVRPSLREAIFFVAGEMNKKYPGSVVNYLDANFPFIDKFPLPPHLSHNDGKKLDLSFAYFESETGKPTNALPSFIGYGISESPKAGEINMPEVCDQKGYWQYNLLPKIVSQDNKDEFRFDDQRTKTLVNLLAEQSDIGKIFIEPHLKTRLGLTSNKVRFHGCQAVRHDDHIHVQLK